MKTLLKLFAVELKLLLREPMSVVFGFLFPLIVLVVITGSFDPQDDAFPIPPAVHYGTAYLAVIIAAISFIVVPGHIANYKEQGILRRFNASGIRSETAIVAHIAVGIIVTAVSSIVLVVASRLIYDLTAPKNIPLVVLTVLLGAIAFLLVGCLIGVATGSARAAQATGMILFFPMWMLCGAGPPRSVMSSAMQTVSDFTPLTYVVNAIRSAWTDGEADMKAIGIVLGIAAAAGVLLWMRLQPGRSASTVPASA